MDRERRMSIIAHLNELRRVLVVSFISILPTTAIGWYYRDILMEILTRPLGRLNLNLVYISPTEAFIANVKLALIAGVLLASPVIAWQFWSFVLPAIQPGGRRGVLVLIPASLLLFAGGILFGYLTVFDLGINFLMGFGGDQLTPMLSLNKYLSFALWFLLPFGLVFELPLVIMILTRVGLVSPAFLAKNRKFAILIMAVFSALVTPPDVVSQAAMILPMVLLYEISIWISRFTGKKKEIIPEGNGEAATKTDEENR